MENTVCVYCGSGHVVISPVEFVWNGTLAKKTDVAWCAICDGVFVKDEIDRGSSEFSEREPDRVLESV